MFWIAIMVVRAMGKAKPAAVSRRGSWITTAQHAKLRRQSPDAAWLYLYVRDNRDRDGMFDGTARQLVSVAPMAIGRVLDAVRSLETAGLIICRERGRRGHPTRWYVPVPKHESVSESETNPLKSVSDSKTHSVESVSITETNRPESVSDSETLLQYQDSSSKGSSSAATAAAAVDAIIGEKIIGEAQARKLAQDHPDLHPDAIKAMAAAARKRARSNPAGLFITIVRDDGARLSTEARDREAARQRAAEARAQADAAERAKQQAEVERRTAVNRVLAGKSADELAKLKATAVSNCNTPELHFLRQILERSDPATSFILRDRMADELLQTEGVEVEA